MDPAPAELTGDPARLRQLVMILVDNAIRHSPGGGRVFVRVRTDGPEAIARRRGRRAGHPARGPAARVRPLLSRGGRAGWRHGSRAGDRGLDRGTARRPDRGREPRRRRRALHGPAAAAPAGRRRRPPRLLDREVDIQRRRLHGRSSGATATASRGGPIRPPPRPPAWPGSCARPASRRSTRSRPGRWPIPAGSGARPPTTSGSPGRASPSTVLDLRRRSGLGSLVGRRVVRLVVGGDRAAGGARPDGRGDHLGGRGRHGP